jgi:hypothetical protein
MAAGHAGLGPDSQLTRPAHAGRGGVGVVAAAQAIEGKIAGADRGPDTRAGPSRVTGFLPGG